MFSVLLILSLHFLSFPGTRGTIFYLRKQKKASICCSSDNFVVLHCELQLDFELSVHDGKRDCWKKLRLVGALKDESCQTPLKRRFFEIVH